LSDRFSLPQRQRLREKAEKKEEVEKIKVPKKIRLRIDIFAIRCCYISLFFLKVYKKITKSLSLDLTTIAIEEVAVVDNKGKNKKKTRQV
jgi:hypothetical protein